jgi:hypothetical protein
MDWLIFFSRIPVGLAWHRDFKFEILLPRVRNHCTKLDLYGAEDLDSSAQLEERGYENKSSTTSRFSG